MAPPPMTPDELIAMSVELQEFAAEYALLADLMVANAISSIPESGRQTSNTVVVGALRRNTNRLRGRINEALDRLKG